MKIDRCNYESYLIDYQEGRLSREATEQLKAFVTAQGMDWETLTEELPQLEIPEIRFEGKEALLQTEIFPVASINEGNFENYFIAYHEGVLSEEEKDCVRRFIWINPSLAEDFKLYEGSYLKPSAEEVFHNKDVLKKKERSVFPLFGKIAAAAALVLLFMVFWKQEKTVPVQKMIAELKPIEAVRIEPVESMKILPAGRNCTVERHVIEKETHTDPLPERHEMPLLADLKPVAPREVTLSEPYRIAHNLVPDLHFYSLGLDYAFAESAFENDIETEEEVSGSFLDRSISQISNGRYNNLGDLFSNGLRHARREVFKTTAKAALTAYYKTDYHVMELKERWQEKIGQEEEK